MDSCLKYSARSASELEEDQTARAGAGASHHALTPPVGCIHIFDAVKGLLSKSPSSKEIEHRDVGHSKRAVDFAPVSKRNHRFIRSKTPLGYLA